MPRYRMRPIEVEAFIYNGESLSQLPQWLQDYEGSTDYGSTKPGRTLMGELLVPLPGGVATVRNGDVLTRNEEGAVAYYKAKDFGTVFEPIQDEAPATEAPAEPSAE